MSGDVLEMIDGALDDWVLSDDAMRWTPAPPERVRPLVRGLDPEAVARMTAMMRAFGESLTEMAERVKPALSRLAEALQPEPPLSRDRRARALQLRQRRHTGPPALRMDGRR